ncbi:MAG: ABC transporter ATP-binding protein [Planctomycetota bacterium]|nr:MAG: ABC transporter ATP-binding protein [Planctomycetota bacterium]
MFALEVDSLEKRYGRTIAVENVSFAVEPGSVFGLLGPNGSGKTTTLACILGLVRPSAGRITVLGERPERLYRTLGRVGVVFDAPVLVRGLSVGGQLAYVTRLFGHEGGRTIAESLELAGLTGLEHRHVGRLSLGQQKRLAVAGALAGRPELLVLDEPLSGLDPPGARALLQLIGELAASGVTVILSSHRLHEVEPVLTHAAILVAGRVARQGTLGELLATAGRHRITVDDPGRAREVLGRITGVVVGEEAGSGVLYLDPGSNELAALNRALVEAGIGVSELRREGANLPALFDALAGAAPAPGGGAR